jgi:hypothetical protein
MGFATLLLPHRRVPWAGTNYDPGIGIDQASAVGRSCVAPGACTLMPQTGDDFTLWSWQPSAGRFRRKPLICRVRGRGRIPAASVATSVTFPRKRPLLPPWARCTCRYCWAGLRTHGHPCRGSPSLPSRVRIMDGESPSVHGSRCRALSARRCAKRGARARQRRGGYLGRC